MPARRGLTEAEKETERAKAKQRWYLKQQGRGGLVDASEMQARIRKLHDVHQISFNRIGEKTGVDVAAIKWHYYGHAFRTPDIPLTTCQWRTHNAIMATTFGPADVKAVIRAAGTQRRLRALVAAGYPQKFLAEATSREHAHLNNFMVKDRAEVGAEHAATVEQVYRKYAGIDPVTVGIPPRSSAYARTVAVKRGYEPAGCWDEDTIDNPEAIPEWTGACGTEEGYRVHVRENIPMCPACKTAVEGSEKIEVRVLDPEAFREHLKQVNRAALADALDVSRDIVYRWSMGDRTPRSVSLIERVANQLGCDLEDITVTELVPGLDPVSPGAFNRHIFAIAVDQSGMSRGRIAELAGVSKSTVEKYCHGGIKTPDQEHLDAISEALGKSTGIFYQ